MESPPQGYMLAMGGPYRAKGSAIFDCIPLGQVEPKVILKDGTEWLRSFDNLELARANDEAQAIEEEDFEDFDFELDEAIENYEDQFSDLSDEEELKEFNIVVADIATPSKDDNDEMGDWPRRLLHVPTLTSFEWKPGNVFGPYSSPEYAAMSYTWGRWMLKPEELPEVGRLSIQGVPWSIPRVHPELFTVEQFKCAIKSCMRRRKKPDLGFIWLDVACINQNEDDAEGALEIGRQAKIFGRASQTFVCADLRYLITYGPFADGLLPFGKGNMAITDELSPEDQREILNRLKEKSRSFAKANNAIRRVTRYPWFSSLWTLQEAFLSPDSYFLDFNGQTIRQIAGLSPTLRDLLRAIRGYHDEATAISNVRTAIQAPKSHQEELFKYLVETNGLDALSSHNPMLLYAQARHRKTTRTEDRVYGIMQVFRFRLGKSATSWDEIDVPLPDLEIQFGVSLAEKFPILSQLHVHSRAVPGRQAWRVSHTSVSPGWDIEAPFRLQHRHIPSMAAELSAKDIQIIDPSTGTAVKRVLHGFFKGETCAFEALSKFWRGPGGTSSNLGPLQRDMGFEFQIALDESVLFSKTSLGIPWAQWQVPRGDAQLDLLKAMTRYFRERGVNAKVLLLGGERSSHITLYGLIIIECHDRWLGTWWARVGICNWQVPQPLSPEALRDPINARMKNEHWQRSPTLAGESDDWVYEEGLFG